MTARYVLESVRRRGWETLAAALGIALTVAFVVSLASFVSRVGSSLTVRSAARVPVDWQVQVTSGAAIGQAEAPLRAVPGVASWRVVDYAQVPGLMANSPTGRRTTGRAYVVALPSDYASFAPGQLRSLSGSSTGVVLQQQTAANLAATPGSQVTVVGTGATVTVGGVVDLPNADSFFQVVGAPAGAGASAPPDNVLLVPPTTFAHIVGRSSVVHQLHVRLDHASLPSDPAQAADEVTRRANHYAAATAGGALVADNLGVALSGAREDALYARLLVLLLGVPGLVLSGVVTWLVVSLRNERQRRDLALLRLRGVGPAQACRLLGLTAVIDGCLGAALGLAGSVLASRLAFGSGARPSWGWAVGGVALGLLLALCVELGPVARLLRGGSPSIQEAATRPVVARTPLVLRLGLDFWLLAGSAVTFWLLARGGYQVVVVPEGVPVASVNYGALLAPALAWPGAALFCWRITALVLSRRARAPQTDPSGRMPDLRHEVVRYRRQPLARAATGLTVAIAVSLSAAVFTATYDRQARVDTALTVGSDVAVTLPVDSPSTLSPAIAHVAGVKDVQQMTHRLVYVGPDLQDIYGVDAATVGRAAPMQDAFTPGSSVNSTFRALARTPNGALLSQETLHDYQLHSGDTIRLRLKNAAGRFISIPFKVAGVITEFATAPRDSFVVANRSYLAQTTGLSAVQTLLVRTDAPHAVAARIHPPGGAQVNDISSPKVPVTSASGLAAGSLSGLSSLTLGFGLLLAGCCALLVLLVGAVQRRRSMTALAVLGADLRQRAGFLWTEARAVVVAGVVGGLAVATLIGYELVKVLNGIFDPPPQHPAVPWKFVVIVVAVTSAAAVLATVVSARWTSRVDVAQLREL